MNNEPQHQDLTPEVAAPLLPPQNRQPSAGEKAQLEAAKKDPYFARWLRRRKQARGEV
jgi:hypothetical protein